MTSNPLTLLKLYKFIKALAMFIMTGQGYPSIQAKNIIETIEEEEGLR